MTPEPGRVPASGRPHHDVVVIGAGFGGIAITRALLAAGFTDFAVLEAASTMGGTWRDNTYPGCRCDIESALYSFSFAPNPDWTEVYASQPEILRYLRRTADEVGMTPRVEFDCRLERARWNAAEGIWQLSTSRGPRTARVLIPATGGFNEPKSPQLPGLSSYQGRIAHTARWPADLDVSGNDVAVIGTGASGVQVVPALQPIVRRLTVVQRTPTWVLPRRNSPVSQRVRQARQQHPERLRRERSIIYGLHELVGQGMVRHPGMLRLMEHRALAHLRDQVTDPQLRAQLTPHYRLGCKRVTPSNDFYPALTQPNTRLVPHAAVAFTENGVVTADGTATRADVVVFATGFEVTNPRSSEYTYGADGRSLAQVFDGHPEAYLGTAVHGFPNMFTMLGPNTGTGHTSVLLFHEALAGYITAALAWMRHQNVAAVEVTRSAQDLFNDWLRRRLSKSVWVNGGCSSWYQDKTGAVAAAWPGTTREFVRMTGSFRPGDFAVV